MKTFLQKYGYGFYLGCTLSVFANLHFYNWRFYAIVVPVITLVVWGYKERSNDKS